MSWPVTTLIGLRALLDDVAETHQLVDTRGLEDRERSVELMDVSMDIGHVPTNVGSVIAPK